MVQIHNPLSEMSKGKNPGKRKGEVVATFNLCDAIYCLYLSVQCHNFRCTDIYLFMSAAPDPLGVLHNI